MNNNIKEKYDTYFLNSEEAIQTAYKNNKVLAPNKQVTGLQICYYDGKEIKNAPRNCINVSFKNFIKYFLKTKNRVPTEFYDKDNLTMNQLFTNNLLEVKRKKEKKIRTLKKNIRALEPNFNDKKLRIFAEGCRETVLIKYIIENIIKAAKNLEVEVYLHKQKNDMQGCDRVHYLKAFYQFNPHITININHFNNSFLSKCVYNIVWFQDFMPVLVNKETIYTRKKDIVFHLINSIGEMALRKNIVSQYQPFCIDNNIYKCRENTKRKKKIIYIGNSYLYRIKTKQDKSICKELEKIYDKKGVVSLKNVELISEKNKCTVQKTKEILGYVEKDLLILKLAKLNTKYKFEIYGQGWESYDCLKSNYKGILNYGKEISKIYNQAVYAFVPGGYILQQRTLEAAASGCIPLVYNKEEYHLSEIEDYFEESLVFFKAISELSVILNSNKVIKKDLNIIVNHNSYEKFIKRIIMIATKGIK